MASKSTTLFFLPDPMVVDVALTATMATVSFTCSILHLIEWKIKTATVICEDALSTFGANTPLSMLRSSGFCPCVNAVWQRCLHCSLLVGLNLNCRLITDSSIRTFTFRSALDNYPQNVQFPWRCRPICTMQ